MMPKFLVVLFLIFPMYIFADDNPREDDEGGKLSDMENAEGNSDNFLIYLLKVQITCIFTISPNTLI